MPPTIIAETNMKSITCIEIIEVVPKMRNGKGGMRNADSALFSAFSMKNFVTKMRKFRVLVITEY